MADTKKTQEVKQEPINGELKEEVTEMKEKIEAKEEETEVKAKVKTKEKPGFFKRIVNWGKRNGKYIGAVAAGVAAGVGGTLGVEKLGEIAYEKKHRNDQAIPMTTYENDDEVLSPNVDE